jgi:glucosamine--fructose-6-phosphate aminotransferase (isomerizing)
MTTENAGALMAAEIAEQPDALRRLLADGAAEIAEVRARIQQHAPRFVLFAARGTSDHAALYAKYLAEIRLGLPAGLASPSTLTVYGSRPDLRDVLFVAVSQSGTSPDLVDSLTAARDCGALTVAVTNDPSAQLAQAAHEVVDVRAGVERAVAATKTYTTELLALRLLFAGAEGTGAVADAAAATLADEAGVAAAQRYRYAERLITTARGYSYPTAREAALKLMETSYVSAQAFSAADLLHGPLAMIDSGIPVIAVVSPGRGGEAMTAALDRLQETGANVLRVGPSADVPIVADGVAEDLLPILEILPLQQLAWRLALDRGTDPDRPRGLAKATSTW